MIDKDANVNDENLDSTNLQEQEELNEVEETSPEAHTTYIDGVAVDEDGGKKKKKKFGFFSKKEPEEKVVLTEEEIAEGERIEKASYSPMSYKQLQKARVRCAEYGVEIPYLKYELTGERKSTLALKMMIIFTSILIAAAAVGLAFAAYYILIPFIGTVFSATGDLSALNKIPVLDMLSGAMELLLWVFALGIPAIAVAALGYCISFLILLIKICNATAEEKAYGYLLSNYRGSAIFLSILALAGGIAFLVLLKFEIIGIMLAAVCFAIFIYCLALFIILNAERKKARAWFATLPEEKQENFKEHFKKANFIAVMKDIKRRERRGTLGSFGGGKGSKLFILLTMLEGFADARLTYTNLKESRYAEKSTALGMKALRYVAYTVVGAGACLAFGAYFLQSGINFFSVIIMVMVGATALYLVAIEIPMALSCSIKQIKLNKKPIGWISLVCILLVIVATIAGLIFVANLD